MKPLLIIVGILILISCNTHVVEVGKQPENDFLNSAYSFLDQHDYDSAFTYFLKARDLAFEQKDSTVAANSLINIAISQYEFGDYFGSQETSIQALEYLNPEDTSQYSLLSMVYNNLSNASSALKENENSINYCQLAIQFARDEKTRNIYKNNLGTIYIDAKSYQKAIDLYTDILKNTAPESIDYARFMTNLTRAKSLLDSTYNPLSNLREALRIRAEKNDLWGLNSSYFHLANYYKKINEDSARFYTQKHYEMALKIKSPQAQMSSLQSLLSLNIDPENKPYFNRYQKIDDSLEQARLSVRNQFALAKYESEKNRINNLKLKNEIAEKQYNLKLQRIALLAILIIIVLSSYYAWNWHKRKNLRIELEADNRIKESQLKTSRKVHDVVANGIYRVMTELENKDNINREELLDRLELIYDRSRDISYEAEDEAEQLTEYHLYISELLKSFSNEYRTVLIAGNEETLWDELTTYQKSEFEKILQELMVNMDKHAEADEVILRFEKNAGQMNLFYRDNGVGMKEGTKFGNGWNNTVNRIKNLNGSLTFDHLIQKGLSIHITFPLNK